ncbi:hypothetical protein FM766_09550 [Francisella tularensis]|nr:hypothetical protein [Francisella tularensis]
MKKSESLLRDYMPTSDLTLIGNLTMAAANICISGVDPRDAVKKAASIVLPPNYQKQPVNFSEYLGYIQKRLSSGGVEQLELLRYPWA